MKTSISTASEKKLPLIAIIGRPNVGKSTLFNRLIRKRRAITDPTPGVTRDPIFENWEVDGYPVVLADTGGVKFEHEGLDALVAEKSYAVLANADVILLLLDVTEVTPEDETLIEALREYSSKIILVVNKVDSPARDDLVWEFHSFGLPRVLGISSTHGLGVGELEEEIADLVDFSGCKRTYDDGGEENRIIKIAVMGKPNTGKSTLTNQLTGTESSIVSEIPGTTRDVVIGDFSYRGTSYQILDTAGIRKKKKVGENIEFYSVNRAIKTIDEADIILMMIDSVEGLSEQDKKIASLIVQKGKGIILVLNKWDKIKHIPNQLEAVKDRTRFLFPILGFAPLIPISAMTGEGVEDLLNMVWGVWKQLNRRIDTGPFNQAIKKWLEEYQIPRGSNTYYKILYGTQTSQHPVQFLLFVNHKKGFPKGYVQYVTNKIRKDLGFPSVPVEIYLRERRSSKG